MTGRLVRTGSGEPSGVPWLDAVGEDEVLVRFSRAIGLPRALPDIHGIAMRVPAEDRFGDLLLASTGLGRLTRFVLTASHDVGPAAADHAPALPRTARSDPRSAREPSTAVRGRAFFELLWSRGARTVGDVRPT